jgi:hypothetical protein
MRRELLIASSVIALAWAWPRAEGGDPGFGSVQLVAGAPAPAPIAKRYQHLDSGWACEACHAAASHHGERFQALGAPPRCATCHTTTRWTALAFEHAPGTQRQLGGHRAVACRACHRGSRPDDFEDFHRDIACKDCHRHRTVHADDEHPDGRFTTTQCLNCHLGESIPPRGPFFVGVHGRSGAFPLTHGHAQIPCSDCHTARSPNGKMMVGGASPECAPACHEDSLHRGSLGTKCSACHAPGLWDAQRFDHDLAFPAGTKARVASFPLRGNHRQATCAACHPARDYASAGTTCASAGCHARDDAHAGHLGNACERCHSETDDRWRRPPPAPAK